MIHEIFIIEKNIKIKNTPNTMVIKKIVYNSWIYKAAYQTISVLYVHIVNIILPETMH